MILDDRNKFSSEEKVLIKCDFNISKKCKKTYYKLYKNILLCRKNNNGKDRCQYCFNSTEKVGSKNFNFKFEKNENIFENIDSDLKAYLLGWVAGDGCLKKDGLYLSVLWIDYEILLLFRDILSPNKPLSYREYDKTLNLIINSVKIKDDLLRHLKLEKVGKKSDKISMPDLNDELKWAFIRGLFDSDGTISSLFSKNTSPTGGICSTSKNMLNDLKKFLLENNIKYYDSSHAHNINFGGKNLLKFLSKIYDNKQFYLTRKKSLYIMWKTWVPLKGTKFRPRKNRQRK